MATAAYLAVVAVLLNYPYVNVTTDPEKLADFVFHVIYSAKQVGSIANQTGLTLQDVNRTLTEVYACLSYGEPNCLRNSSTTSTTSALAAVTECLALSDNKDAMILGIPACISVVFAFIWSFLGKRKSCLLKCCNGLPRAIVPLNMLDSYENRFGYAAAFGVTTSYCTTIIFFNSAKTVLGHEWGQIIDDSPGYVGLLFKIVVTAVIAMSAFPLFVALTTQHKVVGSMFGLMFSLIWFGLFIWATVPISGCSNPNKSGESLAMQILSYLPQFVCLCFLVFKFGFVLFVAIRKRQGKWTENAEKVHSNFKEEYMYAHVKNLLKRVPLDPGLGVDNIKTKIKKKIYKWHPHFKYSIRVICAFFISGITVYYIGIAFLYIAVGLESLLNDLYSRFTKTGLREVHYRIKIVIDCLYASAVISALKTIIIFWNMLAWYRGHMMRLRRGDRSWLPPSMRTLSASPARLVASSMKFAGFQVAYAAWGYLIFAILLWIVLGGAIVFVFEPLFTGNSSFVLRFLNKVWPYALISLVFFFTQLLLAKFCFVQQKGTNVFINNRRAFHIASYYLFFFNIFLGFFSCLLRVARSVVIGVLFLERVQKSLLPRSFERIDPGYYAYIGYILTEHSHANPVLCVFFCLLNAKSKKTEIVRSVSAYSVTSVDQLIENGNSLNLSFAGCKGRSKRWKVARNRWNLAYTLINNPSLAKYRKSNVKEVKQEDINCCMLKEDTWSILPPSQV